MLKNKREGVDEHAYELEEMFEHLFNYMDLSDSKSTTQTGNTNTLKETGRFSTESYQSTR